jgi:chemotaxis protein histidine kinase CheA
LKIPEDPFVRELLPEFVESWINDIEGQYSDLVDTQNSEDLYRMAHTIKGSCFQFGLNEIAELGIELMTYAKEKDWENSKNMGSKIINSFYEVRDFLNKKE